MNPGEREQAQRIVAYVDEQIRDRRVEAGAADPLSDRDREFEELRRLVQSLSEVGVVAPPGFQDALAARLRQSAALEPRRSRWWAAAGDACLRLSAALRLSPVSAHGLRTAALAGGIVGGIFLLSQSVIDVPVVSAQEVLSRSNEALTALVRPGQLLYRQWKVTSTSSSSGVSGTTRSERVIEEWMDGADAERVAGRWYRDDGTLQIAYATRLQDGEYRPYVYFSPGVFDESRGVLNIEPTRREFQEALAAFPEAVRRGLRVYLDRNYIYAPITGERNFNRSVLDAPDYDVPAMPRILVSFDHSYMLNAKPVYRVSLLDSASVTFNWRSSGPPLIRLAQTEIVRYIARDSFLSVRTEERWAYEDGRRRFSTRELVATRPLDPAGLAFDPFVIEVPEGTPVQRQQAVEQLSGVAEVLERVPEFTARLRREPGRTGTLVH